MRMLLPMMALMVASCRTEPPPVRAIERADAVIERMDADRAPTLEWHETRAALAECRAALRACMVHHADFEQ